TAQIRRARPAWRHRGRRAFEPTEIAPCRSRLRAGWQDVSQGCRRLAGFHARTVRDQVDADAFDRVEELRERLFVVCLARRRDVRLAQTREDRRGVLEQLAAKSA